MADLPVPLEVGNQGPAAESLSSRCWRCDASEADPGSPSGLCLWCRDDLRGDEPQGPPPSRRLNPEALAAVRSTGLTMADAARLAASRARGVGVTAAVAARLIAARIRS